MAPKRSKAPCGLVIVPDFLSAEEERGLAAELLRAGAPVLDKSHLRFSNTQQQEYGPQVSDAMELVADVAPSDFPRRCTAMAARVVAEAKRRGLEGAASLAPGAGGFLRVNHYCSEGGGYMHKHMDSAKTFGPTIACCSLLADASMTFYDTHGNSFGMAAVHDTAEVRIPRRSLYFMTGDARYRWQHGIRKDQCPTERLSLTFRSVLDGAPRTTSAALAKSARARQAQPRRVGRPAASKPRPSAMLKRPAAASGVLLKRPAARF